MKLLKMVKEWKILMETKDGFTILESLVVLILVVMSLGLGLFVKDTFHPESIDRIYFWQRFRSRFDLLESISEKDNIPTLITFPNSKKVIFGVKRRRLVLKIPKGLEISRRTMVRQPMIRINRAGSIRPQTVYWSDERHHQNIKQVFELSWGVYRLEKS